jgi:hypothetical protein
MMEKSYIIKNLFDVIFKNNISLIKNSIIINEKGDGDSNNNYNEDNKIYKCKEHLFNILESFIQKDKLDIFNTNINIINEIVNEYGLDINLLHIDKLAFNKKNKDNHNSEVYSLIILYIDIVILSYIFIVCNIIYLKLVNNTFSTQLIINISKLDGNNYLNIIELIITIFNIYFHKLNLYESEINILLSNIENYKFVQEKETNKFLEIIKEYESNLDTIILNKELFSSKIIENVLDIVNNNFNYIIKKMITILKYHKDEINNVNNDVNNDDNLNQKISDLIKENIINIKNTIQ